MKSTVLYVDNLKCGGCEKTVQKILLAIDGVEHVKVDSTTGEVRFDFLDDAALPIATIQLSKAGYTPASESDLKDKAVSYLSCVKGRMSN